MFQWKSTKPTFSGQNQPKLVCSIKTQFFRPTSTKTSFFGQNWPKPLFLAKFDQNNLFRPKLTKTTLSGGRTEKWKQPKSHRIFVEQVINFKNAQKPKNTVSNSKNSLGNPKWPKISQNRPESHFSAKIERNQLFSVKIDQTHFCRPKSTKTVSFGQSQCSSENQPNPLFPAKINQN